MLILLRTPCFLLLVLICSLILVYCNLLQVIYLASTRKQLSVGKRQYQTNLAFPASLRHGSLLIAPCYLLLALCSLLLAPCSLLLAIFPCSLLLAPCSWLLAHGSCTCWFLALAPTGFWLLDHCSWLLGPGFWILTPCFLGLVPCLWQPLGSC